MKAYHWPSEANRHQLCIATKALEAQVRIAKSTWAQWLAYDCMAYCMDPIKAWKAMRTLEEGNEDLGERPLAPSLHLSHGLHAQA
eukprot:9458684-Ditylum_brightwellii.AAC.1